MSTVVWSHETSKDPKIPVELVKPWLEANGDTSGHTWRFEILADGDGTLRWWTLGNAWEQCDAGCCEPLLIDGGDEARVEWLRRWHEKHSEGPFTSPLRVPLPAEMKPYGRAA